MHESHVMLGTRMYADSSLFSPLPPSACILPIFSLFLFCPISCVFKVQLYCNSGWKWMFSLLISYFLYSAVLTATRKGCYAWSQTLAMYLYGNRRRWCMAHTLEEEDKHPKSSRVLRFHQHGTIFETKKYWLFINNAKKQFVNWKREFHGFLSLVFQSFRKHFITLKHD